MAVQNSVRSYVGIAKEVTKGTAVFATDFIPVAQSKFKPADIIDPLYDEGLRGSLVKNYNYIPGRKRSTFDFGGPVFADTFGYVLGGLLGDVSTTGASAPYTHVFAVKNASAIGADAQPGAFTLTDFYAANARQFAGCQMYDLSLKWSADGMLDYDAKAMGWASNTTSAPTPSFSTVLPTPTWQATVSIGGSSVSYSTEGDVNVTRPVTPIYGISNTQNPFQVFVGAVETKGRFRFVMQDDTELTRFLTNTQPAITVNWTQGAGASLTQIQFGLTKGAYTTAVVDRSKDYVEVEITFESMANTTDVGTSAGYGNVKWTLQNAKVSGTYQ